MQAQRVEGSRAAIGVVARVGDALLVGGQADAVGERNAVVLPRTDAPHRIAKLHHRSINLAAPHIHDIVVDGISIADPKIDLPRLRVRAGMLFQHFELFPHLTCPVDRLPTVVEIQLRVCQQQRPGARPAAGPAVPTNLHRARDTLANTVATRPAERTALWWMSSRYATPRSKTICNRWSTRSRSAGPICCRTHEIRTAATHQRGMLTRPRTAKVAKVRSPIL